MVAGIILVLIVIVLAAVFYKFRSWFFDVVKLSNHTRRNQQGNLQYGINLKSSDHPDFCGTFSV